MIELIPIIGPFLAKVLCWPIKAVVNQPADAAIQIIKTACAAIFGGSCT